MSQKINFDYFSTAKKYVESFLKNNHEKLEFLIDDIYRSISKGGVIHGFGTGHSSLNVLEMFHRAGGLIPINPIIYDVLSPVVPPSLASRMERTPNIAEKILEPFTFKDSEVILLFSNSGINSVPIDVARICKSKGLKTVGVTSVQHSKNTECRHPDGFRLLDVVDIVLDTGIPKGDAVIELESQPIKTSPVSTMIGTVLVHSLALGVVRKYEADGKIAPVYLSANTEGATERNEKEEKEVKERIYLLNQKPVLKFD
jgi:uncharacterized phosphosugar-binding protein